MPIYIYRQVLPNGQLGETYELFHGMKQPALSVHPSTQEPIRRVPHASFGIGTYGDSIDRLSEAFPLAMGLGKSSRSEHALIMTLGPGRAAKLVSDIILSNAP